MKHVTDSPFSIQVTLEPADNERLANLCGPLDEHLRLLEMRLGVEINNRGTKFQLIGDEALARAGAELLQRLYQEAAKTPILHEHLHLALGEVDANVPSRLVRPERPEVLIKTKRGLIRPRGENQKDYLHRVATHDINFGVGPAGTGKTYLAVASAIDALERDQVRRILLVRPAVEAGERLGFLPGDLSQKIDPYLRPLYDALYEMLGFERVAKFIERNVIEVAPLAYMRGRTLNESFVILDEAQNTTPEQMKMFLTRLGFGSTAVITGDLSQTDLPRGQLSGLRQAVEILREVEGLSFTFFSARDVVRHPLVQRVVQAYDSFDLTQGKHHGH